MSNPIPILWQCSECELEWDSFNDAEDCCDAEDEDTKIKEVDETDNYNSEDEDEEEIE